MPEQLNSTLGTYYPDNLLAGGVFPAVTEAITLLAGQEYVKGSVIALDAEGKAVLVDSASEIESIKKPYGILTDTVDATTEDKPSVVYLTGEFNQGALLFGGTDTVATHKQALREMGIFLKIIA